MNLLNDLIAFVQTHEAVMAVLSAWLGREITATMPFIKWIWTSGLGVRGVCNRFFNGTSPAPLPPLSPVQISVPVGAPPALKAPNESSPQNIT